MFDVG